VRGGGSSKEETKSQLCNFSFIAIATARDR
jgi:hypothetical protein